MANPTFTVNVLDFGAVGNGIVDDTAAITRALAACPAGGTVLFPAGRTFKTTSQFTVGKDNVTLWGYGAVITSASESQFRKFLFSGRTRGAVLGLRFECLYSAASTGLGEGVVEINASTDITVRDCEFNDIAKNGVYVVGNAARCRIENNQFYRNFCAVFTDDDTTNQPSQLVITGNIIRTGLGTTSTALSGGIKMSGVGTANSYAGHVISANSINAAGQMGIEIQTQVNGTTISDNTVTGCGYGISVSGCSDVSVESNVLKACTSYGIETASSCATIALTGNSVIGKNTSGTITTSVGIILGSTTTSSMTGNTVTGCTNSIRLDGSSYVSLTGGAIIFNSGSALNIKNTTYVNVEGVLFSSEGSGDYFVFVDSTDVAVTSILIGGNTLTGVVASNGILLYTPANSIQNVTIIDNMTLGSFASGYMYGYSVSGSGSLAAIRVLRNTGPAGGSFTTWLNVPVYSTSSSETLDPKTETVLVDASGGTKTITLPTAVGIAGKVYTITKSDSSGNAVTVATTSSQTINGSTTQSLASQYKRITVQSDNSGWTILQSN